MNFYIVPSEVSENTYFVFREIDARSCTEIKVTIRNNLILPNRDLTPEEANYFRNNILEKGDKTINKYE